MGRPSKLRYRSYGRGRGGAWVTVADGRYVTLMSGPKKATHAEAKRAFHALMATAKRQADGISLKGLADVFLDAVKRDLKPLSYDFYKRNIKSFFKHAGDVTATDVRPLHITQWLDNHEWGPTTRHGAITAVKRMFAWGETEGHIDVNPVAKMGRPTPLRREAIMTAEQVRDVFAAVAADDPFHDLLRFMYLTGARPSEAMNLKAEHIDFTAGHAVMESKTTRRTGRPRKIPLTDEALGICRRLAKQNPNGPIFRNTREQPWTRHATKSRFDHLRRRLEFGHEATMESFRHGFATDGLEKGLSTKVVAELMGHTTTAMVDQTYGKIHQREDYLHEAMRKVRPGEDEAGETINRNDDREGHRDDPNASGAGKPPKTSPDDPGSGSSHTTQDSPPTVAPKHDSDPLASPRDAT